MTVRKGSPTAARAHGRPASAGAEALVRPRPPLGLPVPSYGGRSLPNLSATILRAAGGPERDSTAIAPPLDDDLDPFEGRPAEGPVVQLLVDGLGWFDFRRWAERAERGRAERWARAARPITTVFPGWALRTLS